MDKTRVKYVVLPEKRIVKAIIEHCEYDAINMINERFIPTVVDGLWVMAHNSKNNEKFLMRDTYVGVARCHSEDTFDVEKGKAIAYEKLCDKYHAALNRHLEHISYRILRAMYEVHDYLDERR